MAAYADLPLTVAALESAPDDGNRYEVIEGELYVSTAPGYAHQRALGNLFFALKFHFVKHPAAEAILGPGIVFDEFDGVIPDLVCISKGRLASILVNGRLTGAPEIVVEILSPGAANENRDRGVKRKLYSSRGVHEYWIVDPDARTVAVYCKRKEGGLAVNAILHADDELTSPVLPDFRLPISRIFE